MVFRILIFLVLCIPATVVGVTGQSRELCLSCHQLHYAERGGCTFCHLGNSASERKNIAHTGLRGGKYARFMVADSVQKKGGQLLKKLACRRCHIIAGSGNRLAANLDISARQKSAPELAGSIRNPVIAMPDFKLGEEVITELVNVILCGAQGRSTVTAAIPLKVHFKDSGKRKADVFSVKCGACHRILNERMGALGCGMVAPDLSGLLSIYYPSTFKNGGAWTSENLKLWLQNPRVIRQWAKMQPVVLSEAETTELFSSIFYLHESRQ